MLQRPDDFLLGPIAKISLPLNSTNRDPAFNTQLVRTSLYPIYCRLISFVLFLFFPQNWGLSPELPMRWANDTPLSFTPSVICCFYRIGCWGLKLGSRTSLSICMFQGHPVRPMGVAFSCQDSFDSIPGIFTYISFLPGMALHIDRAHGSRYPLAISLIHLDVM